MKINEVFVFNTLYISLIQRSKKISTIENALNCPSLYVKYALNEDTEPIYSQD